MTRHSLPITTEAMRATAHAWVERVPLGWVVEFREDTRTTAQNRHLWAAIADVRKHMPDKGWTDDDWKDVFLSALAHNYGTQGRWGEGLNGEVVHFSRSSSKLTKEEFADLIEIIYEYGARNGVQFRNPKDDF